MIPGIRFTLKLVGLCVFVGISRDEYSKWDVSFQTLWGDLGLAYKLLVVYGFFVRDLSGGPWFGLEKRWLRITMRTNSNFKAPK